MSVKIIDIAGLKKTGKTTVVENLVSELSARGFKVGTLKKIHAPGFTIDQPGKDTYRHKHAGADFVISLAPEEVALIKDSSGRRDLSEILDLIPPDTDFLVCEELNETRDGIICIITLERLDQLEETLRVRTVGENVLALAGVIANTETAHADYPIINTTTESGRKEIVDMILKNL